MLLGTGITAGALAGASLLTAHVSYGRYQSSADPDVIANSFTTAQVGSYAAIGLGVGAGVLALPGLVVLSKKSRVDSVDLYDAYLQSTGQR